MEKLKRLFCILALGAMAITSCQLEEPVPEQEEGTRVSKVSVTVSAGLDNSPKTKSMVADTLGGKMLKFTAGDRLYVRGLITGTEPQKIVAGYLDLKGTPEAGDTCATFKGDLSVYVFKSSGTPDVYEASTYEFGENDPLTYCINILGTLVHKDAVGFMVDAGQNGAYTNTIAATVNDLMTQSLPVYGFYDNGGFPLSVGDSPSSCTPIFNVNLSGLTANAEYTLVYRNGDDAFHIDETRTLGTVTADGSGNATFACYVSGVTTAEEYHGFLLTYTANGLDVLQVDLATKALTSKVYNASRIADAFDIRYVPLTFEAKKAGAKVSFKLPSNVTAGDVQYKLNGGEWTNYTTSESAITLTNVGDKVRFRGKNSTYFVSNSDFGQFSCTDSCYVYGNIMSLVTDYSSDPNAYATNLTLSGDDAFSRLFRYNAYIKNHGSRSLLLPATTLTRECYQDMFNGCTGLTTAPTLPAETLKGNCYNYMFKGCTGLTSAPALPAETLAPYCYCKMFSGCTNLTSAPALPAEKLADGCYSDMFSDCTSLTTAPALPAKTLAVRCYFHMFEGCTGLTTAQALPAKSLADFCYEGMFMNCTSLSSAPALPAETLAAGCYSNMFYGCTSLTTAPALLAETLAGGSYEGMFLGCSSLNNVVCLARSMGPLDGRMLSGTATSGTFVRAAGQNWSSIPAGWTVMEELSTCTSDYTARNGETLTGTLTHPVKISIAAGASVWLSGVTIVNTSGVEKTWAGLTCLGDATINLVDGTTNTVHGFSLTCPGIYWPKDKTLTINGNTGTLTASCYDVYYEAAAGIGSGKMGDVQRCGNIVINGGHITAIGSMNAAGIGSTMSGTCGNITINGGYVEACGGENCPGIGSGHSTSTCGDILITGGTVIATGGYYAPGIGSGLTEGPSSEKSICGTVTITADITSVTAIRGTDSPDVIGTACEMTHSDTSRCGVIKFGSQSMYDGSEWTPPTSGSDYGGLHIVISRTNEDNDTWTLTPTPVTP